MSESIQVYLRDFVGSVLDHYNKVNMAIKRVILTQIFLLPSAYESYIYTMLLSIKYATVLCLKNNVHSLTKKTFNC